MAKSKKPRKAYKKGRWNRLALMIDPETVAKIKAMFQNVEFLVEMKLHTGAMTELDVQCLRDFLNFATVLIYCGKAVDQETIEQEYGAEWGALQNAFHTYYGRACKQQKYTPTGDELKAIRRGAEIGGAIIQHELDHEMFHCIRSFLVMKDLTDVCAGRIEADMDEIKQRIDSLKIEKTKGGHA